MIGVVVEHGGRRPRVKGHIAAQVVLARDIVQIFERIGLGREVLLPIPFLQQFFVEEIAVRPAFGIKAGSRVATPIPRAANIRARFEHVKTHPKFA